MKTEPFGRAATLSTFFAAAVAVMSACAYGQVPARPAPKVQVDLIAEKSAVRPGDQITLALRQRIAPGWHTYWINPGDSGEPTRIEWKLPQGASAGPIGWPVPDAIPVGPMTNYGYSGEVLLLTEISVPADATGSSFEAAADVKWLVCEAICIPEEASVRLSLPLMDREMTPLASSNASAIEAARRSLPKPMSWPAQFEARKKDLTLRIEDVQGLLPIGGKFRFFPLEWGYLDHAAPQQTFFSDGDLILQVSRGDGAATQPPALAGILAVETAGSDGKLERRGFAVNASPSTAPLTAQEVMPSQASSREDGIAMPLLLVMGMAFLGGLILNLMPCVFPVLSLKALSLARDADNNEARRQKGIVYLAGVLVSFAAIGIALIALRLGGAAIGWGMQFQSPGFVLIMMAMFMGLGLNLSGLFIFGGSIVGIGDGLTRKSGLSGYFFTGVLATVVATPCTAPFMGAAMGYAFTQPAPVLFIALLTLGFGFALPILALSYSPALGRWLPRPGPWMESFKQLMAFPLYATVGWLLWVLSVQLGSDGVLAGVVTLLFVGFAAWVFGRSLDAGPGAAAAACIIAALGIALGMWSLDGASASTSASDNPISNDVSGPRPERFSQVRLDGLLAETKPIFVNLTAAWCITCKVNERVALRSERIAEAFELRGITYLVGDWTNADPEITALLKAHGRVGVPLYLLYSGIPGEPPVILPQLLTETIVLNRLAELKSPPVNQAKGDL
jgi:thiol:disulfide interchange protein/DsbC/DsbD-like thiol-disulfide interchange protein